MDKMLSEWILKNKRWIEESGIIIDEIVSGEEEYADESTRVDLLNEKSLTRITAFCTGRLYIQILDILTEQSVFFFDDYLKKGTDFSDFIFRAINKML